MNRIIFNLPKRISLILLSFIFIGSCAIKEKEAALEMKYTIAPIPFKTAHPAAEPNLFTDSLGNIYLTWIEKTGKTASLQYAKLKNNLWSEPIMIAKGDNWFVNWADFPQFVTNGKNGFLASILVKSGKSTYAYDIHLYHSEDGITWYGPVILHDDGKEAEHGFVSMAPEKNKVLISWLDGRNAAMENKDHDAHEHGGAMSLRAGYVDYSGKKIKEWELDNRVCDCCQTGVMQTEKGPIVIYRDRSKDEIRDISIKRFREEKWTDAKPIFEDNWKINGCPVNGPKMDGNGSTIAIAWYAEPDKKPQVKVIFSKDGGNTFGEPFIINDGIPIGRVDICLMNDSAAYVSWMEKDEIKIKRVTDTGIKEKALTIAHTTQKRSAGFPQMTKDGNSLVFAWTDDSDSLQIKTARVIF